MSPQLQYQRSGKLKPPPKTADELPRDLYKLLALCDDRNWKVTKTSKNHWRIEPPNGKVIFHGGTSSDWRAIKNFRAELKRAGLLPLSADQPLTLPVVNVPSEEPPMPAFDSDAGPFTQSIAELSGASTQTAPATGRKFAKPGSLRDAALKVIREIDQGHGVTLAEMYDKVKFLVPSATKDSLQTSLPYYYKQKFLVRRSLGRYSVPGESHISVPGEKQPPTEPIPQLSQDTLDRINKQTQALIDTGAKKKAAAEAAKSVAVPRTGDMQLDHDMERLEQALGVLADIPDRAISAIAVVGEVVAKYQEVIQETLRLKRVLGVFRSDDAQRK